MVRGGFDTTPRGQLQPEDFLTAAGEDLHHRPDDHPHAFVERPHEGLFTRLEQLAERDFGAGVGAHDARGRRQAARLTEVGDLRPLVGALLGTTVELTHRDDRNLEFLREKLEATREFGDLLLTRLDLLAGRHELQVVDDDETDVVFLLEPPRFCADLHHREVR